MFYEIKKGDELVERFNPPVGKDGKTVSKGDADKAAVDQAKKLGGTSVVTSDGRKVL